MAKIYSLYAAPLSWGPKVQIQSVFGVAVWCEFSVFESNTGGTVLFQCWSSENKKWNGVLPGQKIQGQSVWLSAKSTGTGGEVKVAVTGTSITTAVFSEDTVLLLARTPTGNRLFMQVTSPDGNTVVVDPNDQTRTDTATGNMGQSDGSQGEEVPIEFPASIDNQSGQGPDSGPEAGGDGPGDDDQNRNDGGRDGDGPDDSE